MRGHIHITPLGGIAGDMFVAGMLDAFVAFRDPVLAATAAVLPDRNAVLAPCSKAGIAARHFSVPPQGAQMPLLYREMDQRLAAATIPDGARHHARAILGLLAAAEAQVHGLDLDQVHFHEIADWDTLADVTAAGRILDLLAGWSWSLDPLPLGGGVVQTAHGVLPVPAPATAHLMQGLAVQDDGVPGERVTPTGAAILRYIVDRLPQAVRPMGRLHGTGYGAGTRDLPGLANVAVVQVISGPVQAGDTVTVLEWDIDDMTGEEIAVASDHLRACDGVVDLVTWPMIGKKGRPLTGFRILAHPARADDVVQAVFAQTSTLGLRLREDQRRILPRVTAPNVKHAIRPETVTAKAESDSIAGAPTLADRRAMAHKVEE